MDVKLHFLYPENFQSKDKQIFYFLDTPETLPSSKVNIISGWWDVARARKLTFLSDGVRIIMALFGIRKKLKKIESLALVTNQSSANYFHWFNDVVPRLMLLEEYGIKAPIMLSKEVAGLQFVKESLRIIGWESTLVSLNTICKVDKLYIPEMTAGDGSQHPVYFKKVCSKFSGAINNPSRRIFISRQNSPYRNIIRNAEFERLLMEKGVEIIKTENMSLNEQIELFNDCSHLIAVHGAGLTNMAFIPAGKGKILEIRREDDRLNYCYYKMSNVLNHKYYYFLGQAQDINKKIQEDNLIIDIEKFEATLNIFLEEQGQPLKGN